MTDANADLSNLRKACYRAVGAKFLMAAGLAFEAWEVEASD